jgi:hypothetical protein
MKKLFTPLMLIMGWLLTGSPVLAQDPLINILKSELNREMEYLKKESNAPYF